MSAIRSRSARVALIATLAERERMPLIGTP